jgi:hypothetical protein
LEHTHPRGILLGAGQYEVGLRDAGRGDPEEPRVDFVLGDIVRAREPLQG